MKPSYFSWLWPALLLATSSATLSAGTTGATASIDLDRLIACLEQKEGGQGLGGRLCIKPATWYEATSEPYWFSRDNTLSRIIGKLVLQATIDRMHRQGLRVTVDRLACRWRWGYAGMLGRLNRPDTYSQHVRNLYEDEQFKSTN
jgi:hypothetical protein